MRQRPARFLIQNGILLLKVMCWRGTSRPSLARQRFPRSRICPPPPPSIPALWGPNSRHQICARDKPQLSPRNDDAPAGTNLSVEFERVVEHLHREGFLIAGELQSGRYSPRVPAGAVSAKGHGALGDLFAVSPGDEHLRIEQARGALAALVRGPVQSADHYVQLRVD